MTGSAAERIRVGVADVAVTDAATPLVTSGLGSCVAVGIDDGNGVGGLLHAMLPDAPEETDTPAKYVDTGIETMLSELTALDADPNGFTAKIAGGSSMLDLGNGAPIGDENVARTERVLAEAGIDVVARDTGGDAGRTVSFHPTTGTMTIKRVDEEETTL
ncbi:MAG: chemotaxis protein CheD [Halanaeroarchaeum sp.]